MELRGSHKDACEPTGRRILKPGLAATSIISTMAGGAQGLLRALSPNPDCQINESPPKVPAEDISAIAQGLPVATLAEWHMRIVPAMSRLPDTLCAMMESIHI